MGKSPYQKTTGAMRMLAYGASGDSLDEYCRVSETVALESMKRFARAVVRRFGDGYLRSPTSEDLKRIMGAMEKRGFPGCIGSIDCQHWEWKNCPTAYHVQYVGKLSSRAKVSSLVIVVIPSPWRQIPACGYKLTHMLGRLFASSRAGGE